MKFGSFALNRLIRTRVWISGLFPGTAVLLFDPQRVSATNGKPVVIGCCR
jgi:hypothetical protein